MFIGCSVGGGKDDSNPDEKQQLEGVQKLERKAFSQKEK